jgi:hypothetical protein
MLLNRQSSAPHDVYTQQHHPNRTWTGALRVGRGTDSQLKAWRFLYGHIPKLVATSLASSRLWHRLSERRAADRSQPISMRHRQCSK